MRFVNYSVFYEDLKTRGIEYAAEHSKALGFEAVEFLDFAPVSEHSPVNRYTAAEVRRVLDSYGLSVACYSVAVNLSHADVAHRLADLERQIAFAAEIGSEKFHHTIVPHLEVARATAPFILTHSSPSRMMP